MSVQNNRSTLMRSLALFFLLVVFFVALFFWRHQTPLFAAAFTWDQTSWYDGTDAVNFPNHTSNQTGWTKYDSSSGNIVLDGSNNLVLQASEQTFTELFTAYTYRDANNTQPYWERRNSGAALTDITAVSTGSLDQKGPLTGFTGNDVFFIDDSNGWLLGIDGTIKKTENGGTSWSNQGSGTSNTLRKIFDYYEGDGDEVGWIVGDSGKVLKSTGGANNWAAVDIGAGEQLNSVYFSDGNNGWIVGAGGANYVTTTGGGVGTWAAGGFDAGSETLTDVYFVSDQVGWIVGSSATIGHTTNGGDSWSTQSCSGFSGSIYAVRFANENYGWLVGEGGQACETTNGGDVWTESASPAGGATPILYDVDVFGINEVIIVGSANSRAYYSSDGGGTWAGSSSSTDVYKGIDCVAYTACWLGGQNSGGSAGAVRKLNITPTYNGDPSVVTSTTLDSSSGNIYSATLTATDSTPAPSTISYQLSPDGGTSWEDVTSAVENVFTAVGSDLRWRATLDGNGSTNPSISQVVVAYRAAVTETLNSSWFNTEQA